MQVFTKKKPFALWISLLTILVLSWSHTLLAQDQESDDSSDSSMEEAEDTPQDESMSSDSSGESEMSDSVSMSDAQVMMEEKLKKMGEFHFDWKSGTLLLGVGYGSTTGDLNDYAESGIQVGGAWHTSLWQNSYMTLSAALDYRYMKTEEKDLDAPRGVNTSPKGEFTAHTGAILANVLFDVGSGFGLLLEAGPSFEHRSLNIDSSEKVLGDDYFSESAIGFVLRIGAQYDFEIANIAKMLVRLDWGLSAATSMTTGKLKLDQEEVDINCKSRDLI